MAKLTIFFGILLLALGCGSFVATGSAHPTALIPSGFGLILGICGLLANTEDPKKRMLWMHIAVTFGLIGFIGGLVMAINTYAKTHDATSIKFAEQAALAVLLGIFTVLCVRSFIAARRTRLA